MVKRRQNKVCLLQAALLLVCLFSVGLLVWEMFVIPKKNRQMAEQLKEEYTKEEDPEEQPPGDSSPEGTPKQAGEESGLPALDLTEMQAQYPDIKGWLSIPGTNIDYPVLQSGEAEAEYYLKRNYRGEWDANGSLFLQWNCEVSKGQNLIIYGHNMNSGAMFGNLDQFASADYWREHKTVLFQTLQGTYTYEIVSVMKTDVSMFPFQQAEFAGKTGLLDYVKQAKSLGLFGTGALCDDPEQVLTLVTCSYEWESARNVVVAVRKTAVPVA